MAQHFLTLFDFDKNSLLALISRAIFLKQSKHRSDLLKGKVLGLVFEKESTRTRTSFEVAMARLGGQSLYLGSDSSQISRGETYEDTSRVLSRYLDAIVMRTFGHERILLMSENSKVSVINGLTDYVHPCQLLADLMTIQEKFEDFTTQKMVYIGDGNNMTHSWIHAAMIFGFELRVSCPKGFKPDQKVIDKAKDFSNIQFIEDAHSAVADANVINTDTWFSMGQEVSQTKRDVFSSYQVNQDLVNRAAKDVIVMHCLPAHRGEEITDEVMDGKNSVVFDQAENRLYAQMALLEMLMKD
jgi:ornithine carbamoyltransferase